MDLPPLEPGRLIRRYQRFLADVALEGGDTVTAHCPNTGSMLGLNTPGQRVWLAPARGPGRKLAWTWELAETTNGVLVGIHTGRANALVREALEASRIPSLAGCQEIRSEPRLGEGSRADFLLRHQDRNAWLEVKSVTAAVQAGVGFFPHAASERARRHLAELTRRRAAGDRAVVVFCAQRPDVRAVRPADHIDPAFGAALRQAAAEGVEIIALGASVSPRRISLERTLTVTLDEMGDPE